MDLHKINFWKRLEMFVEDVKVNDPMSEEEKDMILRVAQTEQKLNIHGVSGKQLICPMCRSQNVHVFESIEGKGCNSCGHQF